VNNSFVTNLVTARPFEDFAIRLGSTASDSAHTQFQIQDAGGQVVLGINDRGDLIASGGATFAGNVTASGSATFSKVLAR
jgi:hypothetical protein